MNKESFSAFTLPKSVGKFFSKTFSNKKCEISMLEKDIKDIYHEMLDLKRAYCVEWFSKNKTNYFKLVKYGRVSIT